MAIMDDAGCTEQPRGQVEQELKSLEHTLAGLETMIGVIADRLVTALRVEEPATKTVDPLEGSKDALVPVAAAICAARGRIQLTTETLQSIRDRLEL